MPRQRKASDRKSTRLNSSHGYISYAVFCLKKKIDVVALRNAVEPVENLVGHPGEGLDQGDPRVGHVVVGPFRALLMDDPLGVVDQVLEASIVEVRDR